MPVYELNRMQTIFFSPLPWNWCVFKQFSCSYNRKAVLFALLALVALTSALEVDHVFTNCGSSTDPIQVKNVTLTPDPPTKGTTLSVTQSGTSSLPINGGSVNVKVPVALYSASTGFLGCYFSCFIYAHNRPQVYYLGIPVISKTFDVCATTHCPSPAGPFTGTSGMPVPSYAPPGAYTTKVISIILCPRTFGPEVDNFLSSGGTPQIFILSVNNTQLACTSFQFNL